MAMRELCIEPCIRAVGEIGLDFFRGISSRPNQEVAFEVQIDMARSLELPMIIHIRDASGRARSILEEHGYFQGVLHCFTGDRKMAEWAVEHGLFVSFAGNITYDNDRLSAILPAIPRERLMVETDSPYLPPVPVRGGRNEPAFLVHTVRHLAGLLGLTPRECGDLTRENARACYRMS
jgi:TatD DNase family protein